MEQIREAGKKVAVMKSANMSLGVNMLLKLLKEAARTLAPAGFDIEIVEKHHNRKVDAPSGTALAMADSMRHWEMYILISMTAASVERSVIRRRSASAPYAEAVSSASMR